MPFMTAPFANPITSSFGIVPFYKIFGFSVFSARLFSLTCAILAIYATYLIGKKYLSEVNALLAAAFLALNPLFWLYSGIVGSDIPFMFLVSLVMLSVYSALEKRSIALF